MTKRKIKWSSNIHYDGFWISCSINTKKQIDELFQSANYERTIDHILANGIRICSIVEFKKSNIEYTKMLVVPKTGIDKINQLCHELQNEKDIRNTLLRYFNYHYDGRYLRNSVNDELITLLAHHYYDNRERSMYRENNVVGRYLCLIYPVTGDLCTGINTLLKNILVSKSDSIIKDRIHFI